MTENPGQAEEIDPELLELWAKVFGFARSGATAEIIAYVDAGISANLTNDRGDTLVMLAAYHGHADTVAALLERGADANRENDRGQSPLAGAVFKNEPEVVKALLKGGADATAGEPSAIDAARMFGNTELLALLQG
ncbi:ankyrin repeat domain-containing protein [Amycolatopsis sp. NPDC089917]|uniref:ankyrin repeat domain-containing protein n=1 Tax=Amycolatopsis sp. NPDC089917 TaxID=3155187 RepID=UPI003418F77D